jgi:hypothetical protein
LHAGARTCHDAPVADAASILEGLPAAADPRRAAVLEVLSAYLALVEELDLCPWARPARRAGELRVSIELLDEHPGAGMAELVHRLAGTAAAWRRDPGMRVGLALVPDLALSPAGWRQVRDAVGARAREFVLADFHPEAEYRVDTAAQLVGLLRRAPDPLLQLVPHADMKALSRVPHIPTGAELAALLANPHAIPPPPPDPRERVADENFATARRLGFAALAARYEALQALRRARYAAVGIALPPGGPPT